MAQSTIASMNSQYVDTIYADTMFVMREVNLMAGLVTNYTATGMQTRKMSTYPSITPQEVAEGVDFANPTTWTKTNEMTLTPASHMEQTLITDQRLATDPEDAARDAAFEMGRGMGSYIDSDLVALFTSLSTDKGTAGSALTIQRCSHGVSVLRANLVPNPISFVLHPYGWQDVWEELGQPDANMSFLGDTANMAMRSYYVGAFLAATWFLDANITINSSDDAVGAVFHRECFALDTRKAPTLELERDASKQATEFNMSAWYAKGVRRSTFGVKLTHDATEPAV